MGFFNKLFGKKEKESLDEGLQKTKETFFSKISKAVAGKSTVDEEVLDSLEEALVTADVGIDTTVQIIDRIEKRVSKDKYLNTSELNKILQQEIEASPSYWAQQILFARPQWTSSPSGRTEQGCQL